MRTVFLTPDVMQMRRQDLPLLGTNLTRRSQVLDQTIDAAELLERAQAALETERAEEAARHEQLAAEEARRIARAGHQAVHQAAQRAAELFGVALQWSGYADSTGASGASAPLDGELRLHYRRTGALLPEWSVTVPCVNAHGDESEDHPVFVAVQILTANGDPIGGPLARLGEAVEIARGKAASAECWECLA